MDTVLDTDIVVSALLFRGSAAPIYGAILMGTIRPIMCPSILGEYRRVLSYEKFGLSHGDVEYLLAQEVSPFFIPYPEPHGAENWIPEDPSDNKFIDLAVCIPGCILVSGASHILDHRSKLPCQVHTLAEFVRFIN